MKHILEYLKDIELFSGLNEQQIAPIAEKFRRVSFEKDSTIFRKVISLTKCIFW